MKEAVALFRDHLSEAPHLHVVLGSGFGAALADFAGEPLGELPFAKIPGFAPATVPDHAGAYRFYRVNGRVISFQLGRLHGYEGHSAAKVAETVMLPFHAGVRNFLLTNASGGLAPEYRSGDVMLLRDHVNLTGQNPLVGPNPSSLGGGELGPRFPDLGRLYDAGLRRSLRLHCERQGLRVHEGTYLGVLGPSFETPAEVQLFASWGLQAVGMSTVWEAIALGHAGARVAGLSLVGNLAAGLGGGAPLDHHQILATCRQSASRIVGAIHTLVAEWT